jgi:hypothetical protein
MTRIELAFIPAKANTIQHLSVARQKIENIPDAAVHAELRRMDNHAGYWTRNDPLLEDILLCIRLSFRHLSVFTNQVL